MTESLFSAVFLAAVLATTGFKLWLAHRHGRHILAHRGQVPRAFAEQIPLSAHQKAADYTRARLRLGAVDLLVNAAWILALTLGGGLQWLYGQWTGLADAGSIVQGTAFLATLTLLGAVIELPATLYRTFVIEARFGFNKMTPALFVSDTLKSLALSALIGLPVVAAVLWLMSAMGTHWWWAVWLFWLVFNLLVLLIWPTFIAPLFNRFTPLEDERVRGRVDALLARCGFRSNGLFVMDGSRRSAHGNAYFTGFGKSKRIVFFDTLLNTLEPLEVEAVLAHELGHFKRRHVTKRLVLMATVMLALLWLLSALMHAPWFFAGLGVEAQSTAMALALFMIALPVFSFPFSPLMSAWSRKHEFEADSYASEQSDAGALISALVKLYRDNASTLTPDPLYSRIYDSHPPATIRIAHLQGKPL